MMSSQDTDENLSVAVNFFALPPALKEELESTFPEADVVSSRAFSGQKLVSLVVEASEAVIKQLAELFQRWKDSGQEVKGKVGDVEFSIKGMSAQDSKDMLREIRKLLRETEK